jgi:class 3 adenylate cyclase
VDGYDAAEVAQRAGITPDELAHLVELGIVGPREDGRFSAGTPRRIDVVQSLIEAGVPLDGLGAAIRSGAVSLAFMDAPAFERFSALSDVTFAGFAEQSGAPLDLLMLIREAAGSPPPQPGDHIRDDELPWAELMAAGTRAGMSVAANQQLLRVHGDAMRRIAETESALWASEIILPAVAAGRRPDEVLGGELGDRMALGMERALLGMYHLRQGQAWTRDIISGLEQMLAGAGLHTRVEHPSAMCFLDITGYTRLTQERGDAAAAALADQLGQLVQRTAVKHGGRPVKWLGDGVMLVFPKPGAGVEAALQMVSGVAAAGLPPAHVGLHAGPLIFQDGDYYGQTVNLASRIADYARPGEVLVSQSVVDASDGSSVTFRDIGPVELKGVSGAMHLHAAALSA